MDGALREFAATYKTLKPGEWRHIAQRWKVPETTFWYRRWSYVDGVKDAHKHAGGGKRVPRALTGGRSIPFALIIRTFSLIPSDFCIPSVCTIPFGF